ncbi:MAG: TIM barrel protein [Sphingomonadales bacterium]|nr:TIM barrel protein [Sphingomonadales bacterium]
MARSIGLEFISGLGMAPADFVELAARLGCTAIGLAPQPIVGPLAGAAGWTLRDQPALCAELGRALVQNGVSVALGEGFLIMPGRAIADAAGDVAMMADLGAARLNVVVIEADRTRAIAEFRAFAALARAHRLPVTIEFMPGMPLASLGQTLAFLDEAGVDDAGVLVDAMHFFASGAQPAELAAAPAHRIHYAQLCDARAAGLYEGYYEDARCNRPVPGEGVLPLAGFVAALPAACPIGLELPLLARAEAGEALEPLLAAALEKARALLAGRP